jgi:2-keto-4-pentenoate hydratase
LSASWEDPRVRAGLTRQLAMRQRMLEAGVAAIGWKVGFGSPSALELMQIRAPLLGFLTDATLLESGTLVDITGWQRGIVEFEVAVYLGEDLGPGASDEEAQAAVSSVGPAIELADVDLPIGAESLEEILACDIFHKGVILGAPDEDRAGLAVGGLVARILIDGREATTTENLQEITGAYSSIVATVADTLAANGEVLRKGDVIITGSVVPPIPATEGTEFAFALDPFGPITVRVGTS